MYDEMTILHKNCSEETILHKTWNEDIILHKIFDKIRILQKNFQFLFKRNFINPFQFHNKLKFLKIKFWNWFQK